MLKEKPLLNNLVSYIQKNLKKGYTKESLKWALVNQGYSKIEVEKALKKSDLDLANKAPILKTKPEINYEIVEPKEFAMNIEKKPLWKRLFGID